MSIIGEGKHPKHALGLYWFWGKSDAVMSQGGTAVTEQEFNRAVVMALTDSVSAGVIDAAERTVLRDLWEGGLEDKATAAAQGTYRAVMDGETTAMDMETSGALLCFGTNLFSEAGLELTDDELNQVLVSRITDAKSFGRIDAEEKAAINAALEGLPECDPPAVPSDEPPPDPARKPSPYAQYTIDILRLLGVL